jgi:small-conductance mechanosensitive channel
MIGKLRSLHLTVEDDILLADTICSVEGVQKGRDIDALRMEFTENQMTFWTGWWIASYHDRYSVHNRVNKAVIQALKEAGVVLPYRKGRVDLNSPPERDILSRDRFNEK